MKVTKSCQFCGTEFNIWKGYVDAARYCSQKCRVASGQYVNRISRVTKTCQACGEEYSVQNYRSEESKYCSRKCQNHKQYETRVIICKGCGREFYVSPSRKGKKFCSIECRSLRKKSESEYRKDTRKWKSLHYGEMSGANLRRYLKRKFIFECQSCGYCDFEFAIDVHHIDKSPDNNQLDNLLLLCALCHRKIHNGVQITVFSKKKRDGESLCQRSEMEKQNRNSCRVVSQC